MNQPLQAPTRSIPAALGAFTATLALVMLVNAGATPRQPLMVLERVVITGKSALGAERVAQQLPRVLIEGRRSVVMAAAPRLDSLQADSSTVAAVCAQPQTVLC
ncbi:hypothetical protein G8A07_26090 [Roseateles sp. DAIF2]|uniref:hypothetical protein n=1 Tax=Roseateles sp. DAIF2 TaxID=2714952 RepID=UPI0018A280E7|nr:hypothetical protein [Roseateles sp. DAIF2]QPF76051.1 hypothetical protein G8A07_26090 [Roseateles sp. DAIF2]